MATSHPVRAGLAVRSLIVAAALLIATAVGLALSTFAARLFSDHPPTVRLVAPQTVDAIESTDLSLTLLDDPRPLPKLHFVDGDGQAMTLANFRGRALLLNIWATWCVPCRKEMPTLDRLQAKLGGSDFQVITLSIDRGGVPVVKRFYDELGLKSLGIYVDQSGQAASALGTVGIPTTLLVDREGREIARKIGPAEWDSPDAIDTIRRHLRLPGVNNSGPSPDNG